MNNIRIGSHGLLANISQINASRFKTKSINTRASSLGIQKNAFMMISNRLLSNLDPLNPPAPINNAASNFCETLLNVAHRLSVLSTVNAVPPVFIQTIATTGILALQTIMSLQEIRQRAMDLEASKLDNFGTQSDLDDRFLSQQDMSLQQLISSRRDSDERIWSQIISAGE